MKLPSGAELVIFETPFETSFTLYQTMVAENKDRPVTSENILGMLQAVFMNSVASKQVNVCLWECFKHCTYNALKIDKDTFQPKESREDFLTVCFEVAQENVSPFLKNLPALYETMLERISKSQQ